jgi:hypothetical protein
MANPESGVVPRSLEIDQRRSPSHAYVQVARFQQLINAKLLDEAFLTYPARDCGAIANCGVRELGIEEAEVLGGCEYSSMVYGEIHAVSPKRTKRFERITSIG